jgi:hypothetical protein
VAEWRFERCRPICRIQCWPQLQSKPVSNLGMHQAFRTQLCDQIPQVCSSLAKTLQTTSNKSRTGKTVSVKSRGNFAFSDIIITSTRLEKEGMRDLSEKREKLAGPGETTDTRSQRSGHPGTTVDKLQILQTGNGTYQQYHGTNHQASGKSKML